MARSRIVSSFACLVVGLAVIELGRDRTSQAQVTTAECIMPSPGADPAVPVNYPDRFAWQLFVQVNKKAALQHTFKDKNGNQVTTNSALWETWADDPWTFPANPDPKNPPRWPDDKARPKALELPVKGVTRVFASGKTAANFILDTGGEEVHRNKATFDYVIANKLWYTQGIAAFFKSGKKVDFPIDSIEVKGNWVPIKADQRPLYHWNIDKDGNYYGLVAMHITSKAIPNWFWCTFEWVDNVGRCDFVGCHDCFGVIPHDVASNTQEVGTKYSGGTLTPELLSLFKSGGFTGDWGNEWQRYRLKGSQVDFTDSTGRPILVGNSVTEGGFVQTASCMTCHARAAVDSNGNSAFPVFGERQGLPLESKSPQQFQTQITTYHGTPDPAWFYTFTGKGANLVNL